MANILIVGCGDLGTAIANNLKHEHQVTGLRRTIYAASGGMQIICADVTQSNTLSVLSNLNPNIIIYCISADVQTDESYQAQYVTGLKNILATQANNDVLQHVFFVSSTRPFGQKTDIVLDENTPAIPNDFGGIRLLEAEEALKDFCDNKGMPCKSTSMRLSGIYGNGRLYLANMAKDISKWPSDNNWSNRIHRDDAAGFIAFLVNKTIQNQPKNQPIADCYIVTDDMPTQQYAVLKWLAMQQGVDASHIKTPAVSGGKRLSNKRLRETGFQLQYPNYQAGYSHILKK
jgi:NAD dependent epimerase/dehydratase family enzyme